MIDRSLYKKSFMQDNIPNWRCSICQNSNLQIEKDKFLYGENHNVKILSESEKLDLLETDTLKYTTFLKCQNKDCQEVTISSGSGFVKEEFYDTSKGAYYLLVKYFTPKFFYPPLHIFKIPKDTPEDVSEAIISSFSFVFSNQSAAASQIRTALECLLSCLKVYSVNKRDKRQSLHSRIESLPDKYQKIKDICLAIKWLGNAGSHCDDKMSFDDVFDGYDMLSFVLEDLYDNKHAHVEEIAKNINEKKGI